MVTEDQISKAAQIIKEGGTVAFPTETVYGLGANALDPIAVAKIFHLKQRPSFDPLIVHIADIHQLDDLTSVSEKDDVQSLIKRFWPGPLTLILPKKDIIPDLVTSGLDTVGIRMPAHPVALSLIKKSGRPIAAPSANPFGRISPTEAKHVEAQLQGVDMILDGGKTKVGIESTIIKLTPQGWVILRHGGITKEALQEIVKISDFDKDDTIHAPGMLKAHYSPSKPFHILQTDDLEDVEKDQAGLISFSGQYDDGFKEVLRLSSSNDLIEYASHLFSAMHDLQSANVKVIYAEAVPQEGIGIAIMDKLKKAAFEHANQS